MTVPIDLRYVPGNNAPATDSGTLIPVQVITNGIPGQWQLGTLASITGGLGVFNVMDPTYSGGAAIGGGSVDARAAFVAAQTACGTAGIILVPPGAYRIASTLALTSAIWFMPGAVLKPDNGVTITISGTIVADPLQIFDVSASGSIAITSIARTIYPEWWGAKADGSTDCWTGLNAAWLCTDADVVLGTGTYYYTANLPHPTCASIVGKGDLVTILKPGPSVTSAVPIGPTGGNYPRKIAGFQIHGGNTTAATGLTIGDGVSNATFVTGVRCKNFLGAGGVGLRIGNCIKTIIQWVTVESCDVGCLIEYVSGSTSFPTTVAFQACVFRTATNYGAQIVSAFGVTFDNACVFESNGKEGLYVAPTSGLTVETVVLDQPWFESNNNTAGHYHITIDGSAGVLAEVTIDTPQIGGGAAGAIHATGANARLVLRNPELTGSAAGSAAILVENNATGRIDDWPRTLSYSTIVSDPSDKVRVDYLDDNGTPWVPTDQSGAALTFTTSGCSWVREGKKVTVWFSVTYPVTGSSATALIGGLPFPVKSGTTAGGGACIYTNSSVQMSFFALPGTSTFRPQTNDAGVPHNSTLSGFIIRGVLTYET